MEQEHQSWWKADKIVISFRCCCFLKFETITVQSVLDFLVQTDGGRYLVGDGQNENSIYGRHLINLRDINYRLIVQTGDEIIRLCVEGIRKLNNIRYYLALNGHFDAI